LIERKQAAAAAGNNFHEMRVFSSRPLASLEQEPPMVDVKLDPLRWESLAAGDEALLENWFVEEGDRVDAGQVLAKASLFNEQIEVSAPQAGVVEQIAVSAGEHFAPGYILVRLADL
jgi:biotin carboxyl carrier protein